MPDPVLLLVPCDRCAAVAGELFDAPGLRVIHLTPSGLRCLQAIAGQVAGLPHATPHVRALAAILAGGAGGLQDVEGRPLILEGAHDLSCSRCAPRLGELWGGRPVLALTPRGFDTLAAIVNEAWWAGPEPAARELVDLRAAVVVVLASGALVGRSTP